MNERELHHIITMMNKSKETIEISKICRTCQYFDNYKCKITDKFVNVSSYSKCPDNPSRWIGRFYNKKTLQNMNNTNKSIDGLINDFFNFSIEPFFPECEALRQQYLDEEKALTSQGVKLCCGTKSALIRKYIALIRPFLV